MPEQAKVVAIFHASRGHSCKVAIRVRQTYAQDRIEIRQFGSLRAMLVWVITQLTDLDPSFPERLDAADDKEFQRRVQRKRRYFAAHRDTLYLQSQRLADRHTEKIGKYWLATNIGRKETNQLMREIANAADATLQSLSNVSL